MRNCHVIFSLLMLTLTLMLGAELHGKCIAKPKPVQDNQDDQDKIQKSHARLLAAIQGVAAEESAPIQLPSKIFPGDEKNYRTYEKDFFEIEDEAKEQLTKLKSLASDHLTAAEEALRDNEETKADAALALAALKKMEAKDFAGFDFPSTAHDRLKTIQKIFREQYLKTIVKRDSQVRKISLKYVSGIQRLIKNASKVEDIELLVNYRRLISARCDEKSLEGKFVLYADSGEIPKLYRSGKGVHIGPDGVSKTVRLNLVSDYLSLEFDKKWKKAAVFLVFISDDQELQIAFHPSNVRGLIGLSKGRNATLPKILNSEAIASSGDPRSVYKKKVEALKLIDKKDLWFQVDPKIVSVWGVKLAPEMLKSVHGTLTRKSVPSIDLTGIDILKLNRAKKVLLIGDGNKIVSEFEKRGLGVDKTGKYDPEHKDYSKYHTIIIGENSLRKFGGKPISDHLATFIEQGGHLLSLGTYNGEKAAAAFEPFGIKVGFQHNHSFEDNGLASALLFLGTEDQIPADKHLSSTGNITCEVEHTVMLKRGAGSKAGQCKMLTMNVGKGRFTYTQIQPSYRGGNWFVPTLASWISRGSPAPPSQ